MHFTHAQNLVNIMIKIVINNVSILEKHCLNTSEMHFTHAQDLVKNDKNSNKQCLNT